MKKIKSFTLWYTMINEKQTYIKYGYNSWNLKRGSGKVVIAICENCGFERPVVYYNYNRRGTHGRCRSCSKMGKNHPLFEKYGKDNPSFGKKYSKETCKRMSESRRGKFVGENSPSFGMRRSDESKKRMSIAKSNPSLKTRRKMSAAKQGVSYDEWESFAVDSPYCPLFNESCRESNREKYDRKCFICGKSESENITNTGAHWRLSVHHVDMNKDQGCDGHEWKLIPVCLHCHGTLHNERMKSCIEYILNEQECNVEEEQP